MSFDCAQVKCQTIDRTLSGATTLSQSRCWSDGNERVLRISQSSSITGASPTDCLRSYQESQCVSLTPPQRCSRCILQSPHNRLGLGDKVGHTFAAGICPKRNVTEGLEILVEKYQRFQSSV